MFLLFDIYLLALYVTFYFDDHFYQPKRYLLEERLVKVSLLESAVEYAHIYLLVWWHDPDCGFIKPREIIHKRL